MIHISMRKLLKILSERQTTDSTHHPPFWSKERGCIVLIGYITKAPSLPPPAWFQVGGIHCLHCGTNNHVRHPGLLLSYINIIM